MGFLGVANQQENYKSELGRWCVMFKKHICAKLCHKMFPYWIPGYLNPRVWWHGLWEPIIFKIIDIYIYVYAQLKAKVTIPILYKQLYVVYLYIILVYIINIIQYLKNNQCGWLSYVNNMVFIYRMLSPIEIENAFIAYI